MRYRSEIDGIRALAVIPVILFHAGFEQFSGGFVGVDVFFVISGFLITSILIEDIEKNRFSILTFYERRARRIMPALFLVMAFSIPFAWSLMSPVQMKDFSQSLIAVSLFASNILFWLETDYFSPAAEEKPMLHTWSLAVEEQYYLIFPLFLFFAWRFGRRPVFWMIVVFSALSLALSEWGWRNNPSANFYLAPMRAWELFAGSIAAFIMQKTPLKPNNLLSLLGLALVVFAIFAYDKSIPFPSVYALVPVVGTVLLILFAAPENFAGRILSFKIVVGIGLISYSAYLWHQPLFAFARLKSLDHPSLALMSVLSVVSLALAFLSWKYVEQPFRKKSSPLYPRKIIFTFSGVGLVLMMGLGFIGHSTNGMNDYRFTPQELGYLATAKSSPKRDQCHKDLLESHLSRPSCTYFHAPAEIAVFGNSYATELAYSLAKKLENKGLGVQQHSINACYHNYRIDAEKDSICSRFHEQAMAEILSTKSIHSVVLSYRNELYLHQDLYLGSLLKMIETLQSADKKVYLVLQAPLPRAHIFKHQRGNLKTLTSTVKGLSITEWQEIYKGEAVLREKLNDQVTLVNPADYFCDSEGCDVIRNGNALYFDEYHMSVYGSDLIATEIIKKLPLSQ